MILHQAYCNYLILLGSITLIILFNSLISSYTYVSHRSAMLLLPLLSALEPDENTSPDIAQNEKHNQILFMIVSNKTSSLVLFSFFPYNIVGNFMNNVLSVC